MSVYIKDQSISIKSINGYAILIINESAVNSLEEGFEETLAVQRLGVHAKLRSSFTTTNMIESITGRTATRNSVGWQRHYRISRDA